MKEVCGHVKPYKLEMGYGFGAASGWSGLGITYRCPRCCECLWFEDDQQCNIPRELTHNDKKRKENIKWKPVIKRFHPRPKDYMGKKRMHREMMVIIKKPIKL